MSEGLAGKRSASPLGSGSASTLVSCLGQLRSSQGSKQAAGCRLHVRAPLTTYLGPAPHHTGVVPLCWLVYL